MEQLNECQIEIKKLRESTGMNRKEFCECFDMHRIMSLDF